ncbi:MAG: hypothetical protein COT39_01940 [Parcubacteria group bacterium CG08_land_8_20_14_0_20_48_21]|nr:MAG: hypothetical protein AUK21_03075 [Parcubacteria group bacterium CG2_30_48_51]PIS32940.1 MAG: hypothetical protein COT39_01940 [Parcubacteria group bacterium CG08_land_8_20_14_0_20_48_21]PIW79163.1 MAG: hypothetical protein COZ99_02675 [Parcubacteria group bacterium CG_4_8_14_3_um_filter_48_16]PIY77811.1 MAG: hypothetical protein COY83_03340 [Parcubacteria group bacterium CG_4_10_14_0_8_um_filter_48_154]PIZ77976.1 MAG: hypothetical protein COY03_00770 [bacterium CG_4_10_14_0_2_um_filter_
MEIVLDFSFFSSIANLPPHLVAWQLFLHGGWLIFVFPFLYIAPRIWLGWRQTRYTRDWKFIVLAIDVPKNLERTPKAMEQIFSHLAGAYSAADWYEKWWNGKVQPYFSFEIICVDGGIQFLIYTPAGFLDVVEAAVYAQYPDALITEVKDYTQAVPTQYPSEIYDVWGTELQLRNDDMYPIRVHSVFEHQLTQEFQDPLSDMMEMMSRFVPGEQLWLQYIITAIDQKWKERGSQLINKIVGRKTKPTGLLSKINILGLGDELQALLSTARDQFTGLLGGTDARTASAKDITLDILGKLTPGERESLIAIHEKISKTGFKVRFRMIYIARKESFNKTKAVNGMMGSFRQFDSLTLNGIKPNKKHGTFTGHFIFPEKIRNYKKGKVLRAYKRREQGFGPAQVMNIEELATIYHFPTLYVTTGSVMQTQARRGAAPPTLPYERTLRQILDDESNPEAHDASHVAHKRPDVPENLPVV